MFWSYLHVVVVISYTLQSDDACCNSCEEVREAYRKKGWALSDPESIDQVYWHAFTNNKIGLILLLSLKQIAASFWH